MFLLRARPETAAGRKNGRRLGPQGPSRDTGVERSHCDKVAQKEAHGGRFQGGQTKSTQIGYPRCMYRGCFAKCVPSGKRSAAVCARAGSYSRRSPGRVSPISFVQPAVIPGVAGLFGRGKADRLGTHNVRMGATRSPVEARG